MKALMLNNMSKITDMISRIHPVQVILFHAVLGKMVLDLEYRCERRVKKRERNGWSGNANKLSGTLISLAETETLNRRFVVGRSLGPVYRAFGPTQQAGGDLPK
jgi:hypothetical protein